MRYISSLIVFVMTSEENTFDARWNDDDSCDHVVE